MLRKISKLSNLAIGKSSDNYIIVFNGSEIIDDGGFCGVTEVMETKFKSELDTLNIQHNARSSTCNTFGEVATDADYEFYQPYGSSTNDEILAVFNMVDGVYTDTYGLHLFVSYQNVWTTPSDPYTGNPITDPGSDSLLNELRDYWEANKATVDRDIVHLFTGRYPDSSGIVGKAEVGTVCRYRDRSYGFTKARFDYFTTTAHEIGHNFSGLHGDGQNCGTATASIMCQGHKQIPIYFSPTEISRISGYISTYGSCLRPYINVPHGPLCSATVFYITGAPPDASVSWNASPSGIVTLSPSGQSVTVTPISSATNTITLTANVTTDCGSYSPTMNIHLGPPNEFLLKASGDTYLSLSSNEGNYEALYNYIPLCGSIVPPVNIQEIQWSVSTSETVYPFGSSYCSGPVVDGAAATIYFNGPGTRYVYTRAKNACGWSGLSPGLMVDVSAWFILEVAPNPADSYISVRLRDKLSKSDELVKSHEVFEVKLFNERGKLLRNASSKGGNVKLDTQQLPEGTFFLHIKRGEELIKRQIKIRH